MQGLVISSFVFSLIAMICSIACLVIMLAKNFFSSHQVQLVPAAGADPMAEFAKEMGKAMGHPFRELDDPIDDQEREHLENLRTQQQRTRSTPHQAI